MEKYTSTTTTTDGINTQVTNGELVTSYSNVKGVDTVTVSDILLTNQQVCEDRAKAIFLDETYITTRKVVETYHIDDMLIGDLVEIDGILYKVKAISDKVKDAKAIMRITCERWD